MSKKMIEREILKNFFIRLQEVSNLMETYSDNINMLSLIDEYKINILEEDKEMINDIKRSVYLKLKNTTDDKERTKLYKLYQSLKDLNEKG